MQTIIRVEHPSDGRGYFGILWLDTDSFEWGPAMDVKSTFNRHMKFKIAPYEIGWTNEHFCAYKSVEQIQQWILKKDFKALFKNGFKVLMIDVSECIEGEDQMLFKKEHILQTKDITNLFITKKKSK